MNKTNITRDSEPDFRLGKERRLQAKKRPAPIEMTNGMKEALEMFGGKRFANKKQAEGYYLLEKQYGTAKFLEVMTWCAELGMSRGKALLSARTAIKKWGEPKRDRQASVDRRERYAGWIDLMNKGRQADADN